MAYLMTLTVVAETGDGRTAIFEKSTGEPVQYVPTGASVEKMVARWEETFAQLERKARR